MSTIELLAPVGHREGLLAAVANGADAIYVGGANFGARKEAAFTNEELIEVIEFSHLHHVKVYVTVNTTIFDEELPALTKYIEFLYLNKVDAIIVQDIGVANLIKKLYPDFELHFSTQMTLHNKKGVEFAKEFGANRAVISRENTIDEIKEMSKVGLDLEVFVHGALCVSYSGQCLMSSMIGGRSGNRGACAQTCRLPYELVNLETGETLDSNVGNYLLSPRDLKTIDEIGELIESGVTSFKIEGRLKKAEYVATVVRAYRMAIDQYLETKKINVPKDMHEDMDQIFSRGFTKGFLFNESGENWISADRPNHKGILIGKVTQVKGRRLTIKLNRQLNHHDGIRLVGKEEVGFQVQKMFVKGKDVKTAGPGFVEMDCKFPIEVGMDVYKTASVELAKRMEAIPLRDVQISGKVIAKVGEVFQLNIWDDLGNAVSVASSEPIEKAKMTPLSEERLRKQLEKTGSTPFSFEELNIKMDEDMTLPISVLNKLRREALEELEKKRKDLYEERKTSEVKLPSIIPYEAIEALKLSVSVRNMEQLKVVLEQDEVDTIYYKDIKNLTTGFKLAAEKGKILIPQLPRIMPDFIIGFVLKQLQELPINKVVVGDYGMLEALRKEKVELITDFSFNANNVQSIEALKELGVKQATLSYEANQNQIKTLAEKSPLPIEVIVYGRVPMMITKHCPIKLQYQSNSEPCRGAYCMKIPHGLKDRKEKVMPILRTGKCLIEIFNAQPLIWLDYINELKEIGISNFRLEFTNETTEEIINTIQTYSHAIKLGTIDELWTKNFKEANNFTKGHYHRSI